MYSICEGGSIMSAELEKNVVFFVVFILGTLIVLTQM